MRIIEHGLRAAVGLTLTWATLAPGQAVAQRGVTVSGRMTLENTERVPIAAPDSGVISGLTVYLVDVDSGLVWRSETDAAGAFRFEVVPPGGSYQLQVVSGGATIVEPIAVTVSETEPDSLIIPLLFEEGKVVVARERINMGRDPVDPPPEPSYLSEIRIAVAVSGTNSRDTVVVDSIAYDSDSANVTVFQTVIQRPVQQTGWHFGFGAGLASLNTGGFSFFVPAVTLLGDHNEEWYVSGLLGWRPKTITADSVYTGDTGDRAEAIAAIQVSRYFTRTWGAAVGIQAAWESIPEFDEFIKRAVGLTLGGRARVRVVPRRIETVFALDFQLSNLSEFGRPGERTFAPGLAASVTFNYVFR